MRKALGAVLLIAVVAALVLSPSGRLSLQQMGKWIENSVSPSEPVRSGNFVQVKVPAVDNQGNGVVADLYVETINGSDGILVDINNILFFTDTQSSIRTAEKVAEAVTGKDLSDVRLIYSIESDATVIEGESAGAAMTIATIAALENKKLDPNIMITGTIRPDGTIGPVGSVLEKAYASRDAGATMFLVPAGQGSGEFVEPVRNCREIGIFTYCDTTYEKVKIGFDDVGVEVREVSDINEALTYFGLN